MSNAAKTRNGAIPQSQRPHRWVIAAPVAALRTGASWRLCTMLTIWSPSPRIPLAKRRRARVAKRSGTQPRRRMAPAALLVLA